MIEMCATDGKMRLTDWDFFIRNVQDVSFGFLKMKKPSETPDSVFSTISESQHEFHDAGFKS
jgi:hypothetical protein